MIPKVVPFLALHLVDLRLDLASVCSPIPQCKAQVARHCGGSATTIGHLALKFQQKATLAMLPVTTGLPHFFNYFTNS
jgi:hypothetical protein